VQRNRADGVEQEPRGVACDIEFTRRLRPAQGGQEFLQLVRSVLAELSASETMAPSSATESLL
jgi:hypothetical protein